LGSLGGGGGAGNVGGGSVLGGGGGAAWGGTVGVDSAGYGGAGGVQGGGGGGAGLGGAIVNLAGSATIRNSTFTGNHAEGALGGQISASGVSGASPGSMGGGRGAAIFTWGGSLTVVDSTLAFNPLLADAGIRSALTQVFVDGPTTIQRSILRHDNGNAFFSFVDCDKAAGAANPTVGDSTVLDGAGCGVIAGAGGNFAADPELAASADLNGGLTPSFAITTTSPAFNAAGTQCGPSAEDQRGRLRPSTASYPCDMGSFEVQPPVDVELQGLTGPATLGGGATGDYAAAVLYADAPLFPTPDAGNTSQPTVNDIQVEVSTCPAATFGTLPTGVTGDALVSVVCTPVTLPPLATPPGNPCSTLATAPAGLECTLHKGSGIAVSATPLTLTVPVAMPSGATSLEVTARVTGHSGEEIDTTDWGPLAVTTEIDSTPPGLTLEGPAGAGRLVTAAATFGLRGAASDSGSSTAGVRRVHWVNDTDQTSGDAIGADGGAAVTFLAPEIPLELGDNHLTVTATDNSGGTAEAQMVVTRLAPEAIVGSLLIEGTTLDTPAAFAAGVTLNDAPSTVEVHLGTATDSAVLDASRIQIRLNGVVVAEGSPAAGTFSGQLDVGLLPNATLPAPGEGPSYALTVGVLLDDGRLVDWPVAVPLGLADGITGVAAQNAASAWTALADLPALAAGEAIVDLVVAGEPQAGGSLWAVSSTPLRQSKFRGPPLVDPVTLEKRYPVAIRTAADVSHLHRYAAGAWTSWTPGQLGLSAPNVALTAVRVDGSELWIGTNQGLAQRPTADPTAAGAFFDGTNGPAGSWVTGLALDLAGNLWVAHRGLAYQTLQNNVEANPKFWSDAAGVSCWSGSAWTRYRAAHGADGHTDATGSWLAVAGLQVSAVDTSAGQVWVASELGLSILDTTANTWQYESSATGMPFTKVGSLAVAEVVVGAETQTWAWVGSPVKGAAFLRVAPGGQRSWSSYRLALLGLAPIASAVVQDVAVDAAHGVAWIATDHGVASFDPASGRLAAYVAADEAGSGAGQALAPGAGGTTWSALRQSAGGACRFARVDLSLASGLLAPPDGSRLATAGHGSVPVTLSWAAVAAANGYEVFLNGRLVGRVSALSPTPTSLDLTLAPGDYSWTVRTLLAGSTRASAKLVPRQLTVLDDTGPLDVFLLDHATVPAPPATTTLRVHDVHWTALAAPTQSTFAAFADTAGIVEGSDLTGVAAGTLTAAVGETGGKNDLRGHWSPLAVPAVTTTGAWRIDATSESHGYVVGNTTSGEITLWDGQGMDVPTVGGNPWVVANLLDVAGLDGERFAVLAGGGAGPRTVSVYARDGANDDSLDVVALDLDLATGLVGVEPGAQNLAGQATTAKAIAGLPGGGFAVLTDEVVLTWDWDAASRTYVPGGVLDGSWSVPPATLHDLAADPRGRIAVWLESGGPRLAVVADLCTRGAGYLERRNGNVAAPIVLSSVTAPVAVATLARPAGLSAVPDIPYLPAIPPPSGNGYSSRAAGPLTVASAAVATPGSGTAFSLAAAPIGQPTYIEYFLTTPGTLVFDGTATLSGNGALYLELDGGAPGFGLFADLFGARVQIAAAGWTLDTVSGVISSPVPLPAFAGLGDLLPSTMALLGLATYPTVSRSGIAIKGALRFPDGAGGYLPFTANFDHLFLADFDETFVATFGQAGVPGLGAPNQAGRFWFQWLDGGLDATLPVLVRAQGGISTTPATALAFDTARAELCAAADGNALAQQLGAFGCSSALTLDVQDFRITSSNASFAAASGDVLAAFRIELATGFVGDNPAAPGTFGVAVQGSPASPGVRLTVNGTEQALSVPGAFLDHHGLTLSGSIPVGFGPVAVDLDGLTLRWYPAGDRYFSLAALAARLAPPAGNAELVLELRDVHVPFEFFQLPPGKSPTVSQAVVRLRDVCEPGLAAAPSDACGCDPCASSSCPFSWTQAGKTESEYFRAAACSASGFAVSQESITLPPFTLWTPVPDGAGGRVSFPFPGATIAGPALQLPDKKPPLYGVDFDLKEISLGSLAVKPGAPAEDGFEAGLAKVSIRGDNAGALLDVDLRGFRLARIEGDPSRFRLGLREGSFRRHGFNLSVREFDIAHPICQPLRSVTESDPVFAWSASGIPIVNQLSGAVLIDSAGPDLALVCLNAPERVKVGALEITNILLGSFKPPIPTWAEGDADNNTRWPDPLVFGGRAKWARVDPLDAHAVFDGGKLAFLRADATFTAPGRPLGQSIFLQRIAGEMDLQKWDLTVDAEFSGGPQARIPLVSSSRLLAFYVKSRAVLSSQGYLHLFTKDGLRMLYYPGVFDGFKVADAELILGKVYRDGIFKGNGVFYTGYADLFGGVLRGTQTAWMYFEEAPVPSVFRGDLDAQLRVPDPVPVVGGLSFGGVGVGLEGTLPPAEERLTLRGRVYVNTYLFGEIGVNFRIDDGGFGVDRAPAAGLAGTRAAGVEAGGLQLFTDFARLPESSIHSLTQTDSTRVFAFQVTDDVPLAVARLDFTGIASGDADVDIRFPDGTVYTASNSRPLYPVDPNAPAPVAGELPISYRKHTFAGTPAGPGGPEQPALDEVVYMFAGPLAWQPVAVVGADGVPTSETTDQLLPTPVPHGTYEVTVRTAGLDDARDTTFDLLLANNPPSFASLAASDLGGGQERVDWTVADADGDPVTVTLRLSTSRTLPEDGFPVGQLGGWEQSGANLSRSVTVAACSPAIRARDITAPLHLFAGIEDGRDGVVYRYLDSFPPCPSSAAPPPVADVVVQPADGAVEVTWTPLTWEPPAGSQLVSYALTAMAVGPPGTDAGQPVTTGVPLPQRTSDELPTNTNADDWILTEVHAQPDAALGDANGDGGVSASDQFAELYNDSGHGQDVSGWQLAVAGGSTVTLPAGTYVPDRCALVVFGGSYEGTYGNAIVRASSGLALPAAGSLSLSDPTPDPGTDASSWTASWPANDHESGTLDNGLDGSFVPHSQVEIAGSQIYSPGTLPDGGAYVGCAAVSQGTIPGLTNGREYRVTVTAMAEREVADALPICSCSMQRTALENDDRTTYCHPQFGLPPVGDPGRQAAVDALPFDVTANPLPIICDQPRREGIYDEQGAYLGSQTALVTDVVAGIPTAAVSVVVGAQGANNAPRIVSTPTHAVELGASSAWTYLLKAIDSDGDDLHLLVDVAGHDAIGPASKLPVELVIYRASDGQELARTNPATAPLVYVPPAGEDEWLLEVRPGADPAVVGSYAIRLTVADDAEVAPGGAEPAAGTTDTQSFFLGVVHFAQSRHSSVITSVAPRVAYVDQAYRYDLEVTNAPAGFAPGFHLAKGPPGMMLDAATGVLSWLPTAADVATGPHLVVIEVFDPEGNCDFDCLLASESFALEVQMNPLAGVLGVAVLAVTPSFASVVGPGGTVAVTLANLGAAGTSIPYQLTTSNVAMFSIPGGLASGTVSGQLTVPVVVQPNPDKLPRSGELTVAEAAGATNLVLAAPQSVTVAQLGNPEQQLIVTPASTSLPKAAGAVAVGIQNGNPTPGPMTWTATVQQGVGFASLSMDAQTGQQSVTWTNNTSETKTFQVVFPENFVAQRTALIRVTSGDASNSPVDFQITQSGNAANLSVAMVADVAVIEPGADVTYTITVVNLDPANSAVGVRVVDSLPAQLTFLDTLSVFGFGPGCFEGASGHDTCTLARYPTQSPSPLAPGETRKYQLRARGNIEAVVTTLVTVVADTPDPTSGNNVAQVQTTIANGADLTVTKTDGVTTEIPGTTATYTVTVSNAGPGPANGALVEDTPPAGLSGVSFSSVAAGGATGNDTSGSGTINDTVNLPPGGSITYTLTGTIVSTASGTLANTATITVPFGTTDPNPGNNSATDSDTLVPTADLEVTKDDSRTTVIPGRRTTYTILVSNPGPSAIAGATVTDLLPTAIAEAVWESRVLAGTVTGNPPRGTGSINHTVDLSVGAQLEYRLTALVDAAAFGELDNTASVAVPVGSADPVSGNNSATDSDNLTPVGDLAIDKTDGLTAAVPGEDVTYTVTVTNRNIPGTLYFSRDTTGVGQLYRLDGTTAAATLVGPSGATGSTVGLAASLDGEILFGSKPTGLLEVRTDGSGATQAGTVESEGLAFDSSTNTLYRSRNAGFGTLDPTTGAVLSTLALPTPILTGSPDIEGLDFGAGVVFALLRGERQLFVYDPGLGTWSTRGDTGIQWLSAGLAYDRQQQVLYAKRAADMNLYRINPANGATTVVGSTGMLDGGGLAFVEPPAYSRAAGATISDDFPAALLNPTWTCVPSPGSACSDGSGDPMSTMATVAAEGQVVYTITAHVDPSARGQLLNTATVTPPFDFTDLSASNDLEADEDSLTPQVDLKLTETESIDPVVAGSGVGNLTHQVTLTNQTPSTATGIVVTETFTPPVGVTVASVTPSLGTWNGADSWSVPTLLPGASQTLTIVYTVGPSAAQAAQVTDSATVTAVEPRINTGDDATTISTSVERRVDLAVSQAESLDPVIAGSSVGNLTYVVTVQNLGPSNASGVTLNEALTLPAGVTVSSVTPSVGSYAAPTWTVGNLAFGASATLTVVLTVAPSTAHGATVSATASVATINEIELVPENNSASVSTGVIRRIDLGVTKTESIDPVIAGSGAGNLVYVVTLTNHGPSDASGIAVGESFVLPAAVSVGTVTPSVGTYAAPTWSVGTLAAGANATLSVAITVGASAAPGTDVIADTATVSAHSEVDISAANDAVTERTSIGRWSDLALAKADEVDPVDPFHFERYTLTVSNFGPSDSSSSTVVDQLPVQLAFDSSPDGCTAVGQTVTCPMPAIAVNGSAQVVFDALVVGIVSETVVNSATVSSAFVDPLPANNTATEQTTIDATRPQVAQVELLASTGAIPVPECAQLQDQAGRIRLTFSEPILNPAGDTTVGDVTNPTSYLLVEAGLDHDLDSTSCTRSGDDVAIAITSAQYDGAGPAATLQLARTLNQGLYRLMACGLEDLLGNGLPNGEFDRQLRIDLSNLLINGHFDCGLLPFVENPVGDVSHDPADIDGAAVSGSLHLVNAAGEELMSAEQCVNSSAPSRNRFSARVRATVAGNDTVTLGVTCTQSQAAGCAGPFLQTATVTQSIGTTFGSWQQVAGPLSPEVFTSPALSMLCRVSIQARPGLAADVFIDELALEGKRIFADDFEVGSTGTWTAHSP
jgi:uncharacterized repeat protein (TIGR01451 family)